MEGQVFFSIVVPTFNRPDELEELMKSLLTQHFKQFELILVDGSPTDILHPVVNTYRADMTIKYFHKKGLKASPSRNYGVEHAAGQYVTFVDSDCILPEQFLEMIHDYVQERQGNVDAYGGPDAAHPSFTTVQKAINYAMTSTFTTGGIRGKKKHIGQFQLRGFNMGMKREVFQALNGYSQMEVAEDIDLSMRLWEAGYKAHLIADAYVWHKRRVSLTKFWKQLFMHGKGRIDLYKRHKNALKAVHLLPSVYVLCLVGGILLSLFSPAIRQLFLTFMALHYLIIFIDASYRNKSLAVGFTSVVASFVMLVSYGLGLMYNYVLRVILGSEKESDKSIELKN